MKKSLLLAIIAIVLISTPGATQVLFKAPTSGIYQAEASATFPIQRIIRIPKGVSQTSVVLADGSLVYITAEGQEENRESVLEPQPIIPANSAIRLGLHLLCGIIFNALLIWALKENTLQKEFSKPQDHVLRVLFFPIILVSISIYLLGSGIYLLTTSLAEALQNLEKKGTKKS